MKPTTMIGSPCTCASSRVWEEYGCIFVTNVDVDLFWCIAAVGSETCTSGVRGKVTRRLGCRGHGVRELHHSIHVHVLFARALFRSGPWPPHKVCTMTPL